MKNAATRDKSFCYAEIDFKFVEGRRIYSHSVEDYTSILPSCLHNIECDLFSSQSMAIIN